MIVLTQVNGNAYAAKVVRIEGYCELKKQRTPVRFNCSERVRTRSSEKTVCGKNRSGPVGSG